ncbi:MAG: hypothetical protein ACREOU_13070 [Candidatus Eiseniibacteriota bacterium]
MIEHDDPQVREDLKALRSATESNVPALPHVIARARSGASAGAKAVDPWRERFMKTVVNGKSRPWLATAGVAVFVALALLVVPVSYERTTGHQVTLSVSGASLDGGQAGIIAKELKSALEASSVMAAVESENGAESVSFVATVPGGSAANLTKVAQAFAHSLDERGYTASAEVRATKERVSGNVYAFARDRVIQIPIEGKDAAQLEAEIRQQLAAAGITDAVVSVTDEPLNGRTARKVTVEAHKERHASGAELETNHDAVPQIVLTKDGQPLAGQGASVRVMKTRSASGVTLKVEAEVNGQTTTTEIPNADTMSDAEIASALEAKFREAGINARVTVTGGKIDVQPLP